MERLLEALADLRDDAAAYCEGKLVWLRGVLLGYLVYAGLRHLADPLYRSWFGGITLVVHELGHLLFELFGRVPMILGGSITQLAVPVLAGAHLLLRQRDYFGLAVCGAWLGFSEWDLATYVADALREELPLVGFSDDPQHDWATLLTEWHVLNHADRFATALRVLAFGTWLSAVLFGGWLCWRMLRSRTVFFDQA